MEEGNAAEEVDLEEGIAGSSGGVRDQGMGWNMDIKFIMKSKLAIQSLGIICGDLGISPLYVYHSTFPEGINKIEDILGALSLIIYTLILIALIKYVVFVLKANASGEGGTFALYSLICRSSGLSIIPNAHSAVDTLPTNYPGNVNDHSVREMAIKWVERNKYHKNLVLFMVLFGTCMLICAGILTPAISVLSSVGGINVGRPYIHNDVVVVLTISILVGIFGMQHYGIDQVAWLFNPIVLVWLLSIGAVGVYNIIEYDRAVVKAFSPYYIMHFFMRKKMDHWISLGGIILCVTGTEALFADLRHSSAFPLQVAFTFLVFPSLLLAYMGQAAYLMKHPHHISDAFYRSVPDAFYWPIFVLATLTSVISSHSSVSATFSVIKQSIALGCFPPLKVVYSTSRKRHAQIYVTEINWFLMILCLSVTIGFQNTIQIGYAYATAAVSLMLMTTVLMAHVMLIVWEKSLLLTAMFTVFFFSLEMIYLSAVLGKMVQGGWVTLATALFFLVIMYTWRYGTEKRQEFEKNSSVPLSWITGIRLHRVPGIALVYTDLESGVPNVFSHFVTHLPAINAVAIFVCVKCEPVPLVDSNQHLSLKRIGPKHLKLFRCLVRYGYMDAIGKDDFEILMKRSLCQYVSKEEVLNGRQNDHADEWNSSGEVLGDAEAEFDEVREMVRCFDDGVVHIVGYTTARAKTGSGLLKRISVDYVYAFLRRISHQNAVVVNIRHENLLNVGQVFYV